MLAADEGRLTAGFCHFGAELLRMGPMKRKSNGGQNESKPKTAKAKLSIEQLEEFPHIPKVTDWFLAYCRVGPFEVWGHVQSKSQSI